VPNKLTTLYYEEVRGPGYRVLLQNNGRPIFLRPFLTPNSGQIGRRLQQNATIATRKLLMKHWTLTALNRHCRR